MIFRIIKNRPVAVFLSRGPEYAATIAPRP